MSRDYIAFTLKRLREAAGLTINDVGEMIGKSGKTVSAWENGRGQPDAEILIKLCGIYHVTNMLAEFDEDNTIPKDSLSHPEIQIIKKYRTLDGHGKKIVNYILSEEYDRCTAPAYPTPVPTITIKHSVYKVSAGFGFDLEDRDEWDEIDIPDTTESRRADFAITIKGDSMEPIYSDGDIVLVKVQSSVNIGETGIFIVNGSGFIKQYGGDRLISINSKYDDILFSEGDTIKCAGKVIGIA